MMKKLNTTVWVNTHYLQVIGVMFYLNPYRAGTELSRFNWVNIMAADALAPYVARTSAATIFIV